MTETIDRSTPDAYTNHLAEVNETKQVLASEDIRNSQGALILKKGTPISQSVASKILKHHLSQPLEESVEIDQEVNSKQIEATVLELTKKYPDFNRLLEQTEHLNDFRELIQRINTYSVMKQKLTVMAHQFPEEYDKSCFCAWFSTIISRRLKLNQEDREAILISSLLHDIGLLHIDPAIVTKKGDYTPEEWRAMQSHVVIGNLIVKSMPGVPPSASRAIIEHHENCLGTGYPKGKFSEHLSLEGQIVALCDELYPIRVKKMEPAGKNIKNAIPILQLNNSLHFYSVFSTVTQIIQSIDIEPGTQLQRSNIQQHCTMLFEKMALLKGWIVVSHTLGTHLPDSETPKALRIVHFEIKHLKESLRYSGLLSEGIERWLMHLMNTSGDADEKSIFELEEIDSMYEELTWQFKKFRRHAYNLLENKAAEKLKKSAAVKTCINQLDKLDAGEVPTGIDFSFEAIDTIVTSS